MVKCSIANSDPKCFTSSWHLTKDQIFSWFYIQAWVIGVSIIFDWVNPSRSRRVEQIRVLLTSNLVQIVNSLVQLVGSLFVCLNWVTRGGNLAVEISAWSIESIFLIFIIVSYCFRWLGSKDKVIFTLQIYNLFDLLSITSHFAIAVQTVKVESDDLTAPTELRSWLDFGFLRSYILYAYFGNLFNDMSDRKFMSQMVMVMFQAGCIIFFSASILFSLESLGEIPHLDSLLLHVYDCSRDGGRTTQRTDSTSGFAPGECSETWSAFTAIYFMFVTVSTVGYGDFSPSTVLGRFVICIFIIVGIYKFANETSNLVSVYEDERMGRGAYEPGSNSKHGHVLVLGNPSTVQLQDFIREFFHPDHLEDESIDDLPDIVVLVQFDGDGEEKSYISTIRNYVSSNKRYRNRVVLLSGSPLSNDDLLRIRMNEAKAIFFIPNKYERDANKEDAANVLRILAIIPHKAEHTFVYAMILNSDNQALLEAAGISQDRLICVDEIKMSLLGLSCRCVALSTLISNLVSSRSSELPENIDNSPWIREYVQGASNEVYACYLDVRFQNRTFTQACQEILQESDGQVLLIGIEDENEKLSFNPGDRVMITERLKVFVIAEAKGSLAPFENVGVQRQSALSSCFFTLLKSRPNLLSRAKNAKHDVERRVPNEVVKLIERCNVKTVAQCPPDDVLQNPHIIVCSNVMNTGGDALQRFRKFVKPLRAPHLNHPQPIVIVDEVQFDEVSWKSVSDLPDLYHVQGSPLSHETLHRAGIKTASAVIILAQGDKDGYDDSKAIFNTILIDALVPHDGVLRIIELTDVVNNNYLDPIDSARDLSQVHDRASYRDSKNMRDHVIYASDANSSILGTQLKRLKKLAVNVKNTLTHADYTGMVATAGSTSAVSDEHFTETFYQSRYITGSLFPSFVADNMLIQSYFNASINLFVAQLLENESCFALYDIPNQLRKSNLTYGELFHHMTSSMSGALPIGLYRWPTKDNGAKRPYVYTSPYAHTIVHESDRVYVIVSHYALHRTATKVQQLFRAQRAFKRTQKSS